MQAGVYILTVCLIITGLLLVSERGAGWRFYGRNIILSGKRFKSRAEAYSRRMKFREWLKKLKGERVDREIYESISFLRNIIAAGGGVTGADYIIEQLSRRDGVLRQVYIKMLRFLRLGRKEDAVNAFSSEAFTPIGHGFGDLLLKWDDLNPSELTEILISYQKNIKEVKSTAQKRRDETVSELMYFPVVLNVFIIFINFIMIGYFMEQKQMLNVLF